MEETHMPVYNMQEAVDFASNKGFPQLKLAGIDTQKDPFAIVQPFNKDQHVIIEREKDENNIALKVSDSTELLNEYKEKAKTSDAHIVFEPIKGTLNMFDKPESLEDFLFDDDDNDE